MTRRERMIDIVAGLGEAYRQAVTEVTVNVYDKALSDLPIDDIEQAAFQAMRECKFMPTVKELRELATGVKDTDRSVLAWNAVLSVQLNPYTHIDFDDGIINATIRNLGGWPTFVERFTDSEAEKWLRKEFCDTYSRLLSAGVDGDVCRPLAGLAQASVSGGVLMPPKVLRIDTGMPAIAGRIGPSTPRLGDRNAG